MVLKLDLSKVYDRICCVCLQLMLLYVSLYIPMVKWIMGCISSISISITIDGVSSTFFKPGRGLGQGCSLYPLLFLLVVEGLSRVILNARSLGIVTSITIGISIYLAHFLFDNNVLLFINGSTKKARKLKEISKIYKIATWMEINL